MELTQLIQFKEAAECENFTVAANNLFITQQGLSKSIKKLENELHCQLFDRIGAYVRLNEQGKNVLAHVYLILDEVSKIKNEIDFYTNQSHHLRIGTSSLASIRFLFTSFCETNSHILLSVSAVNEKDLKQELLNNNIDIAISHSSIIDESIECIPFLQERLMVIVPITNSLFKRDSIRLRDLEGQFVLRINSMALYLNKVLDELCKKNNYKINFIYQDDYVIFNKLRENNKYISFISNISNHMIAKSRDKKILMLTDKELTVSYYINYFNKNNANVIEFRKWLAENYSRLIEYER